MAVRVESGDGGGGEGAEGVCVCAAETFLQSSFPQCIAETKRSLVLNEYEFISELFLCALSSERDKTVFWYKICPSGFETLLILFLYLFLFCSHIAQPFCFSRHLSAVSCGYAEEPAKSAWYWGPAPNVLACATNARTAGSCLTNSYSD
jgi:hypothetical protein